MVMACGYAKITSGVAMNRKDTLIEEQDIAQKMLLFPKKTRIISTATQSVENIKE